MPDAGQHQAVSSGSNFSSWIFQSFPTLNFRPVLIWCIVAGRQAFPAFPAFLAFLDFPGNVLSAGQQGEKYIARSSEQLHNGRF